MIVARTTHRRPGGTLYRSLIAEMIFPTVLALGGFTLAVLTNDLVGLTDLVINRGLPASTVLLITLYKAIPITSQMVPFAVLVGALVALGRLGADREILVLEASGISAARLLGPVLAFAAAMTGIAIALSLYIAPWSHRQLDATLLEASRIRPGAAIQAGAANRFGQWRLQAREVSSSGDSMRGVLVWLPDARETVFAEAGHLESDETGSIRVTLENGAMLPDPRVRPREIRFEQMTLTLPREEKPMRAAGSDEFVASTLRELALAARGLEAKGDGTPASEGEAPEPSERTDQSPTEVARAEVAQRAWVELNQRLALPVATLVFGLLVVPLFLSRATYSRAGGAVLGLVGTVVYYGLVQLGQTLVQAGMFGVTAGVWLPNLVLGGVALLMAFRLPRMSSFGRHSDRTRERSRRRRQRRERADAGRIRAHRWPLQRYVAGRFVRMALLCFTLLLVAYLVVDVLERMRWIAHFGATGGETLRYFGARLPLLASRVVPMALLAGTALTVSLLAVQGELVAIRACGIPAPRALLPILAICGLVAPAYFLLNNEVLPRSNALQHYLKYVVIKGSAGRADAGRFWHLAGDDVYEVDSLDTEAGTATNLTIYRLRADHTPVSRSDAREARHIGGGFWRLVDPMRVEVSADGVREVQAAPFEELGQTLSKRVDTRHLSVGELGSEISELEDAGFEATPFRVDYWVKIATPVACLVLPALALLFAVSGPPFPSSALTLMMSVAVAVAYVLLTGVGTSLGYSRALSPVLAAWAPNLVFAAVATYLGLRLRGFGQTF